MAPCTQETPAVVRPEWLLTHALPAADIAWSPRPGLACQESLQTQSASSRSTAANQADGETADNSESGAPVQLCKPIRPKAVRAQPCPLGRYRRAQLSFAGAVAAAAAAASAEAHQAALAAQRAVQAQARAEQPIYAADGSPEPARAGPMARGGAMSTLLEAIGLLDPAEGCSEGGSPPPDAPLPESDSSNGNTPPPGPTMLRTPSAEQSSSGTLSAWTTRKRTQRSGSSDGPRRKLHCPAAGRACPTLPSAGRPEAGAGRDSSRLGAWTPEEKQGLLALVAELEPCGAADWEAIADRLGRWSPGGASAERMYRTLTDPGYQKTTNKHGRRLNARCGTPMHIMAAFALRQLPNNEGNLTQIAQRIAEEPRFAAALQGAAAAPRPGTKTYARWKDALVGCFKAGRYAHFSKSDHKIGGLKVYRLEAARMPAKVDAALAALAAGAGLCAAACDSPAGSSVGDSGCPGS